MRLWASVSNYMMTVILHKLQRSLHSMVDTNRVQSQRGGGLLCLHCTSVIDARTPAATRETSQRKENKQTNKGYKSEGEETAAMVCARSTGAARKWWNGVYASRFVTFAQ